jgi:cold shock protein
LNCPKVRRSLSMRGFVHRVMATKGFGFIRDGAGQDFFFHCSAVVGVSFAALTPGTAVEFNVEQSPRGQRAVDVAIAAL